MSERPDFDEPYEEWWHQAKGYILAVEAERDEALRRVEAAEEANGQYVAVVIAARGLFPPGTRMWDSTRFVPLRDALAALADQGSVAGLSEPEAKSPRNTLAPSGRSIEGAVGEVDAQAQASPSGSESSSDQGGEEA